MPLLHLVIKIQRNGRNKIYASKHASNQVLILLLDVKMAAERFDGHLQML